MTLYDIISKAKAALVSFFSKEPEEVPFDFMGLPVELRTMVYDDLLGVPGMRTALQQTSSAIRAEINNTVISEPLRVQMEIGLHEVVDSDSGSEVYAEFFYLGEWHDLKMGEWHDVKSEWGSQMPPLFRLADVLKRHTSLDVEIIGNPYQVFDPKQNSRSNNLFFMYVLCSILAAGGICKDVKVKYSDPARVLHNVNIDPIIAPLAFFGTNVTIDMDDLPSATKTTYDSLRRPQASVLVSWLLLKEKALDLVKRLRDLNERSTGAVFIRRTLDTTERSYIRRAASVQDFDNLPKYMAQVQRLIDHAIERDCERRRG